MSENDLVDSLQQVIQESYLFAFTRAILLYFFFGKVHSLSLESNTLRTVLESANAISNPLKSIFAWEICDSSSLQQPCEKPWFLRHVRKCNTNYLLLNLFLPITYNFYRLNWFYTRIFPCLSTSSFCKKFIFVDDPETRAFYTEQKNCLDKLDRGLI